MAQRVRLFGTRISPFVEKVVRALTLKRIAFELVDIRSPRDFVRWNPQTRKMPVLEVDGERSYDSTFILRRLDQMVPEPPLIATERSIAAAQRNLEDWADESLYWYGMALRWMPTNAPATTAQILGSLSPAIRTIASLIVPRQLRAMTRAQGLGRLPEDIIVRELGSVLDDLVTLLGNRRFFYADQLSAADLALYGQFHMLTSGPTPQAESLLRARPALIDHMRRVEAATGG